MGWILYDHINLNGRNTVKEWCEDLQTNELAKLNQKIDMLEKNGHEFCPALGLNIKGWPHLYKLKVHGPVAVRLFFCRGPIDNNMEYTFLLGAFERDGKLPRGTREKADAYREAIKSNPQNRRRDHERAKK